MYDVRETEDKVVLDEWLQFVFVNRTHRRDLDYCSVLCPIGMRASIIDGGAYYYVSFMGVLCIEIYYVLNIVFFTISLFIWSWLSELRA